jgi:hypothetical protein
VQNYVEALLRAIDRCEPALLAIGDDRSAARPAPGKWSPREIIGHLIDSASNNHERFVRAQLQDHLVFSGYDQDAWVDVQRYEQADWADLVGLWAALNRHLARVMALVPEEIRRRERPRHNLHEIAFQMVPAHEPATLDFLMGDYVAHLQHHLRQVLGAPATGDTEGPDAATP